MVLYLLSWLLVIVVLFRDCVIIWLLYLLVAVCLMLCLLFEFGCLGGVCLLFAGILLL